MFWVGSDWLNWTLQSVVKSYESMNERFGTVGLSFAQDARSHFILWIHSRLERRHHDIEQLFQRQHQSHVDSQYSLASNKGLPSGKPT